MGLFSRRAASPAPQVRAISYQDVWGKGYTPDDMATAEGREALKLSVVQGCVRLRSNLLAQLPLRALRAAAGGGTEEVASKLLDRPSQRLPGRTLWLAQGQISRDLWGNAWGYVVSRDGAGWPTQVEWLPPWELTAQEPTLGAAPEVRLQGQPVDPERLVHVPGFTLPGTTIGMAPLDRAGLVELAKKAREFGRDFFNNGGVPSSILYSDKDLTQEAADDYRDNMMRSWRRRRPAVMGRGFKLEQVQVNPDESQFLTTLRHVQVDICMAFLVPPEELGIAQSGSSVTYANREQRQQQVLINGLNMDLATWQEALTAMLPRPQVARFNTGALLRSDFSVRAQAYALLVQAGIMAPNEAREFEDWPPLPGGDTLRPTSPAPVTPRAIDPSPQLPALGEAGATEGGQA